MTSGLGQVFTPRFWARWLLVESGAFESFLKGGNLCDPTAGEGVMALALGDLWRDRFGTLEGLDWKRICLIERDSNCFDSFKAVFRAEMGCDFPSSRLLCRDFILDPPAEQFQVLVGNPPWVNFADLPSNLKDVYKPLFLQYGLVRSSGSVLLGRSRIDLSALVVHLALSRILAPEGLAAFFVPLSLFLGEGSHDTFRQHAFEGAFQVKKVVEWEKNLVFPGVSTRYCAFWGIRRVKQDKNHSSSSFPLLWKRMPSNQDFWAFPAQGGGPGAAGAEYRGSSLWVGAEPINDSVLLPSKPAGPPRPPPGLGLTQAQRPRQGLNTGGCNSIFFVDTDTKKRILDQYPPQPGASDSFYPLISGRFWEQEGVAPKLWALVTHGPLGRPLEKQALEASGALEYVFAHQSALENRKGVLLRSWFTKGYWWAMMGAGAYLWAPWKVVWPAYGVKDMHPVVLGKWEGKPWIPNQALQAYIPCSTEDEALKIQAYLKKPEVGQYLRQQGMEGSKNWAQPGRLRWLWDVSVKC